MQEAKEAATVKSYDNDPALVCPHCRQRTPISMLRGDRRAANGTDYGLRLWENNDLVPRHEDVFQERLYCIRWVEVVDYPDGTTETFRYYRTPNVKDLQREEKVLPLLRERFHDWQEEGYLPSCRIVPEGKTDEPIRTRGWTYWHHLFNPRQLLLLGYFGVTINSLIESKIDKIACYLGLLRLINYNSKLSRWDPTPSKEMVIDALSNQAFNTLYNYGSRSFTAQSTAWFLDLKVCKIIEKCTTIPVDGRNITTKCDIWISDPPYADAINYHELSEFFLAW